VAALISIGKLPHNQQIHNPSIMAAVAREFVSNQYAWFSGSVWPPVVELWDRLDVPEFAVYKQAVQACARDSWQASQSTYKVLHLTLRPLLILLWIISKFLWRNLLEHGGKSLQKGALQLKYALIAFYQFQISLTPMELLGEAGIIGFCVAAYYFQKWLRRQTYWSRTVRWYRGKKAQCVEVRTVEAMPRGATNAYGVRSLFLLRLLCGVAT
jgi:hypothetical protein